MPSKKKSLNNIQKYMPEFYHELITEKSFKVLQDLRRKFDFILIGGWAVFLYAKTLKSKDIDIVIEYDELKEFRKEFDFYKNERLKKYEAKTEKIDIDIYLPYFSEIGFPLQELKRYIQSQNGFIVPKPEILLILKTLTIQQRKGTIKGEKDLIDIFSLLSKDIINWKIYQKIIKKYNLEKINGELKKLVSEQKAIPELKLLNHQMSKLKEQILKNL